MPGKTWNWHWNANTAPDMDHYRVQVGNSNFSTLYFDGNSAGTSFSYSNNSLPYGYLYARVKAVDHSGNESAWSPSVACNSYKATSGDLNVSYAGGDSQGGAALNTLKVNGGATDAGYVYRCSGSLEVDGDLFLYTDSNAILYFMNGITMLGYINGYSGGTPGLEIGGSNLLIQAAMYLFNSVTPQPTDGINLGSAAYRFNEMHCRKAYIGDSGNAGNIHISTDGGQTWASGIFYTD